MLKVDDLKTSYGKIEALKGISLEVNEGEIVTLIGANGAGKSTTLKTISGQLVTQRRAPSSSWASRSAGSAPTRSRARASSRFPRAGASSRA